MVLWPCYSHRKLYKACKEHKGLYLLWLLEAKGKRSNVESMTNWLVLGIFIFQLVLSAICAIGFAVWGVSFAWNFPVFLTLSQSFKIVTNRRNTGTKRGTYNWRSAVHHSNSSPSLFYFSFQFYFMELSVSVFFFLFSFQAGMLMCFLLLRCFSLAWYH